MCVIQIDVYPSSSCSLCMSFAMVTEENGEKIKGNAEDRQSGKTRTTDKSVALLGSREQTSCCSLFLDRIMEELGETERFI